MAQKLLYCDGDDEIDGGGVQQTILIVPRAISRLVCNGPICLLGMLALILRIPTEVLWEIPRGKARALQ